MKVSSMSVLLRLFCGPRTVSCILTASNRRSIPTLPLQCNHQEEKPLLCGFLYTSPTSP